MWLRFAYCDAEPRCQCYRPPAKCQSRLASWFHPRVPSGKPIPHKQQFLPGRPTSSHSRRAGWRIFATHARHTTRMDFAVNHFIVRQRQNKVFGMVVQHSKGQLVVMILAAHWVQLHIVQRAVHPAQFHLYQNPVPPVSGDASRQRSPSTPSAMLTAPGNLLANNVRLVLRRNSMASVFHDRRTRSVSTRPSFAAV